jgi:hypothetical protein
MEIVCLTYPVHSPASINLAAVLLLIVAPTEEVAIHLFWFKTDKCNEYAFCTASLMDSIAD